MSSQALIGPGSGQATGVPLVAVRNAQNSMLIGYLATVFANVLAGVFALIQASPGAGVSNDALFQYILAQTSKTTAELEAACLAYARSF